MIRIFKSTMIMLAAWVVAAAGYQTVTHKLNNLRSAQYEVSTITADMREKQLDCLARNIYHEAGHEPFEGKVAVAQVTINRTENVNFPSDICKVVYQKNVVYEKVLCQFSWYCDQAALKRPLNKAVYTESMEVAKKVLLEGFRIDAVKNALYYHADYVQPGWGKKPITKIGHHVFYN